MNNYYSIDEIGFLQKHIELIRPTMIDGKLPSCIHMENFRKNVKDQLDDILPYICFGGYVNFDRNVEYIVHTGNYYICAYIASGKLEISNENQTTQCTEEMVLLAYKNSSYNIKTLSRECTIYFYFVCGSTIDSYAHAIVNQRGNQYFYSRKFNIHSFIIGSLEKINYFLRTSDVNNLYMESIMFQYIFVRLLTTYSSNNPFDNNIPLHIAKLKRILDTRYYENHTLDSLQEELNISKYRLCREFSQYYDISPLKYLNQVRIDKAKEFLLETNETIVSIGNEVGIENTTHFINLFKRQTGDTPLKYRQSHLGTGSTGKMLFPTIENL